MNPDTEVLAWLVVVLAIYAIWALVSSILLSEEDDE